MKKIFALLFLAAGAFVLTACGENNPYSLDKEKSLSEVSVVILNNPAVATAKTVNVPAGVVSYNIERVNDTAALILTMDNGTMKLAKEDFTTITSGSYISQAYEKYFYITSTVDADTTYGLFDFEKGMFLIPLSTNEVQIETVDDYYVIAIAGSEVYNLETGNRITDGKVGSKAFNIDALEDLIAYKDGYIKAIKKYDNYTFFYYDIDFNLVDNFSTTIIGQDVEYFISLNGNILFQIINETNISCDFDYYDGDTPFNYFHYLYEAKTGNKQELDLPFLINDVSFLPADLIETYKSMGLDYSNLESSNYAYIEVIENKTIGTDLSILFNESMTEIVHVYDSKSMPISYNDNLYLSDKSLLDKDGNLLNIFDELNMLSDEIPYTIIGTPWNASIVDENGKIMFTDLNIIEVLDSTYAFSTNSSNELIIVDFQNKSKKTIATSYSNLDIRYGFASYVTAEGTKVFISYDGTTLFTVSSTGTSSIVDEEDGITYVSVTDNAITTVYLIKKN